MGQQKQLLCDCGRTHQIDTTQAGSILPCACGAQIQLPPLREIAQLPNAQQTDSSVGSGRWTHRQGIFFGLGAAILLLAFFATLLCLYIRPSVQLAGRDGEAARLDSYLATLNPAETLKLWEFYQMAPGLMVALPEKMDARQAEYRMYTTLAWSIAAIGIAVGFTCVAISLRTPRTS